MVDLRRPAEVEAKGVPAMPKGKGGSFVSVPFDTIGDRSLRSAVVSANNLEAESTARIIASLRKAAKSRPTIILDSNASQAAAVARKLSSLGFQAYVAEGGLDGWARSGLAVQRTAASSAA